MLNASVFCSQRTFDSAAHDVIKHGDSDVEVRASGVCVRAGERFARAKAEVDDLVFFKEGASERTDGGSVLKFAYVVENFYPAHYDWQPSDVVTAERVQAVALLLPSACSDRGVFPERSVRDIPHALDFFNGQNRRYSPSQFENMAPIRDLFPE